MSFETEKSLGTKKRVLLAEDGDIVRKMVGEILALEGFEVVPAADGREAFDYFKQHGSTIDLIVTDIVMPNMDGKELVQQCRREIPDIAILYMSGYTDSRIDPDEDLQGNTDFIAKPFRPTELVRKVNDLIKNAN
jgi:two-component system, cell cycle sensor histidine kinase and response regulator CckA